MWLDLIDTNHQSLSIGELLKPDKSKEAKNLFIIFQFMSVFKFALNCSFVCASSF